ncbi:hypothetical protein FRACYDRAFT_267525 [Fragilariopsis cylindrus CCMP1102]|uniref:Uncharacterized protein n=1 Tax=Fragilariopsis cylindrus CCMP1102 TaxID=635003 RepID=A0A1E7FZ55_9STRA|nr:hypothetical protein FRACYDRAFT_267525 [Fragilariopsis cylindrus CCMP1102]|eukprot:OEU23428.1 hypothetical protein FRACYDRAFT_267525 [Fragilariopsis cylindrus CCMP1102]
MVAVGGVLPVLFIFSSSSNNRGMDNNFGRRAACKRKLVKTSYRYDVRSDIDLLLIPPKTVLVAPSSAPLPSLTTYDEIISSSSQRTRTTKSYRKIRKFFKAGTLDIPRICHSIVGLSSILVGLHHMSKVLLLSSFTNVECKVSAIVCTGGIHTLAGLLGIRRLNFKSNKEAARNAMFWPAPIQSLWLASVSLTEWGQGSGAFISMKNPLFTAFTTSNVLLTVWQLSEILRKTGVRDSGSGSGSGSGSNKKQDSIWFQKSAHNAILVEFSYLLWMQLQMGTVLYIIACRSCSVGEFSIFMDAFPNMQSLLSNLALNTAFFNNLAVFVATLVRYNVLSKPKKKYDNVIVFSLPLLSSIFIVWKVLSCFFLSYDGTMSASFFSLLFR